MRSRILKVTCFDIEIIFRNRNNSFDFKTFFGYRIKKMPSNLYYSVQDQKKNKHVFNQTRKMLKIYFFVSISKDLLRD